LTTEVFECTYYYNTFICNRVQKTETKKMKNTMLTYQLYVHRGLQYPDYC